MSPGLKITMLLSIYAADSGLTHNRGQTEGKTLSVNRRKCLCWTENGILRVFMFPIFLQSGHVASAMKLNDNVLSTSS